MVITMANIVGEGVRTRTVQVYPVALGPQVLPLMVLPWLDPARYIPVAMLPLQMLFWMVFDSDPFR